MLHRRLAGASVVVAVTSSLIWSGATLANRDPDADPESRDRPGASDRCGAPGDQSAGTAVSGDRASSSRRTRTWASGPARRPAPPSSNSAAAGGAGRASGRPLLDRSFISGIASSDSAAAIIRTLVQLGKTLDIETLAEGIEQPAQLEKLQQEHCDQGQGFLFARPLDVTGVEDFLEAVGSTRARTPATQ